MTNNNKLLFIILLIPIFQTIFASEINASKVIYTNDFESDQVGYFPSNWEVKRNFQWNDRSKKCMIGSVPAEWKVASISGSKRAGIALSGQYCQTEIIPTNIIIPDLSNYQYEVDMTFFGSANKDRNIAYRYNNGEEWYGLKFTNPTTIEFYKIFRDSPWNVQYRFVNYSEGFKDNTTYRFKVVAVNNILQFFVNNVLIHTISDVDPILSSGTIALQASIGGLGSNEVYFDNIVVTDLSEPPEPPKPLDYILNTPFFSQLDPKWRNTIYDHSYWWVSKNGTIGRWGCALTSAAMILKDRGFSVGPDNQETNPENLNEYLKRKLFGYNEWGGIIWPTVTKYAEDTIKHGYVSSETKSLEFSYLPYNHDSLITQLDASLSGILKIQMTGSTTETKDDDGYHFVVAKGYTNPDKNILLNDPLTSTSSGIVLEASYSGKPVRNMISFQPSHTDLSYLWFSTEPGNTLSITKNGQPITLTDTTYYIDGGITDGSGKPGPMYRTLAIPKPETGKYTVTISTPATSIVTLDTALFDQDADAKHTVSKLIVGPQFSRVFTIEYNHDNSEKTKIRPQFSIGSFKHALDYAWKHGWLRGDSYHHLKKVISNADWYRLRHPQYSKTMFQLCKWYLPLGKQFKWINPQAHDLLQTELDGLMEAH